MRSFYIDEASIDSNYGIYESLILNDITHHESEGVINSKQYLYKYNINSIFNDRTKITVNNYDFKFSIKRDYINIIPKDDDIEVNHFNMEVIINMLNEVYSYNKERNNKMFVLLPGHFFVDERNRYSNDIKSLISECQIKYDSMLKLKEKTI